MDVCQEHYRTIHSQHFKTVVKRAIQVIQSVVGLLFPHIGHIHGDDNDANRPAAAGNDDCPTVATTNTILP